ncbi:metallophosphoesterase [Asanoa sp. WMMD1127]|uniref:metallophosphoesterase n=1 Tax=Asanoa sp. WMMD1127 TaxID=3016107 RepID=UPI0024175C6A|nr:metallophosphoesterase [Asanoa sp. WMMD1127]MDG4823477.1 metallophosphoesterase [Asanoa sp. WMMD1127]
MDHVTEEGEAKPSRRARVWSTVRRGARSGFTRRTGVLFAVLGVALVGLIIGVLLGARAQTDIGPFQAEMSVRPAASGETEVVVPPLGALHLDSHDGPLRLTVRLGALDQGRTQALISDPSGITRASQTVVDDLQDGLLRLGFRTVAVSILGAVVIGLLVFRSTRRAAWCGGVAMLVTAGTFGIAAGTLKPDSIEQPRYEGLLVNAPAIVGDARRIAQDYGKYAEQLKAIVANVSRIYTTVNKLPIYEQVDGGIRILHVSDLHLNPSAWPTIRTVVEQFDIDAVIDTGDITDWGSEPEANYVGSISLLGVPYVYIRGNHDSAVTAAAVGRQRGAVVLQNQVVDVAGLRIAGIGDPRFTPDKETSPAGSGRSRQVIEQVYDAGARLATTIRASGKPADVCLVHDPESAPALNGVCPTILAGHIHHREVRALPSAPGITKPSRVLVEGSTGGAGLRGLEGEQPTPLQMSVLYFDDAKTLQAYDDIQLGGTGQAQVTLNRTVIARPSPTGPPSPTPTLPTPTPTATTPPPTPTPQGD